MLVEGRFYEFIFMKLQEVLETYRGMLHFQNKNIWNTSNKADNSEASLPCYSYDK